MERSFPASDFKTSERKTFTDRQDPLPGDIHDPQKLEKGKPQDTIDARNMLNDIAHLNKAKGGTEVE